MKTRVSKNKDLHQKITADTESVVESSDLSHFANRLNEIDDQFTRMNVEKKEERILEHARQNDAGIENTLDQKLDVNDSQFDTFESAYLKDFLEEVKEYNVKKGYRDLDNTSSNIMKELKLETEEKSRAISQEDLGFVKPNDLENLESVLSEINDQPLEDTESLVIENADRDSGVALDKTQVYKAVDHTSREDYIPAKSLDETIAMAVMSMNDEDELDEDLMDDFEESIDSNDLEDATFFVAPERDDKEEIDDDLTRTLLEQTQTLQYKIVDQEKSLEEMSDKMVHTNRLLNGVLSMLMLAIVVVLMFIVSNIWKG